MNKTFIGLGVLMLVLVLGIFVASPRVFTKTDSVQKTQNAALGKVIVHRSPTCGCCGVFVSYMKGYGYDVEVDNTDDIEQIKRDLHVPTEVESCHTTEVGGYIVEGHIPEEVIHRLLTEKPDIAGIGMAGMPAGSPGMPGPKIQDFVIYEINHNGSVGNIFATI